MAKEAGGAAASGRGARASTSRGLALTGQQKRLVREGPAYINAAGHRESDKIVASTLGLSVANAFPTGLSGRKRRMDVPLGNISLGRDALHRDRLLRAAENLSGGVKAKGRKIEPIRVAQTRDGRYVVQGDGNHRIAALKLMGYRGKVPVVATLQSRQQK